MSNRGLPFLKAINNMLASWWGIGGWRGGCGRQGGAEWVRDEKDYHICRSTHKSFGVVMAYPNFRK